VYRSSQEQDKLYEQGRTTKGPKVTNAKGGLSKHNTLPSKAIDIAFKNGKVVCWDLVYFKEFARIIQKTDSSIKWGGNFGSITDNPHFEI
jgi:peptidoglycan L-alanyl-D-glutamate endopeptidase CwlK